MDHHQSAGQVVDFNDGQKQVVTTSMLCTLMSKIKFLFQNPLKNKQLAQNENLLSVIDLIAENLLPHYCSRNYRNSQKLGCIHSLCFLLASKVQAVFTSGVIKTCIDQNWDLKGFKAVLLRILSEFGLSASEDCKKLQELFDKMIQSQNLQSQSCIKAISYYLKNRNKANIDEDDLKNPIVSFQTTFDFVKDEIQQFRSQNMSHTCFTVLHPWAYDLDQVDFKYVINKDQTVKITEALEESNEAQVFWLSYFKSQLSCSADEFVVALRELAQMNNATESFDEIYDSLKVFLHQSNFVVNVNENKNDIIKYISYITKQSSQNNILTDQVKIRQSTRQPSELIEESKCQGISTDFTIINQQLPNVRLVQINTQQSSHKISFKRTTPALAPSSKQPNNLYLKFTNVDTEELKDLEIKFDGNLAQFKVGEGDCNHYIICNDKKLWESQFMILNKDGNYYIRDLGIVHTSRIKVNQKTQLQIHQGALLDLGKVVHYHVDKLLHEKVPTKPSDTNFIVMKGSQANYKVDDEALLRARPTWISQDENKDLVQNEIILENSEKNAFTVGRSNKRDVEIKLKAVSADHCKIEYKRDQGWFVHENEKERLSSNGTFVFMKSWQQIEDHEPSDFIPLFNGMTVSFINYELQVRIEPKTAEELAQSKVTPVQDINTQVPVSVRSNHQQDVEEQKITPKQETPRQEQQNLYDEDLQATHNQKDQPQFLEEQKSVKSLHQQSHHQDEEQQEDIKSQHSQQQHLESQHSHRSSKQSLHQQQQQDFEDIQKSQASLQGVDDLQHNQSVHSQHDDIVDDVYDDQKSQHQASVHKDPSQKSLRQSVQSAKDLIVDNQQQQDADFSVHHADDIQDDQVYDRKSQLSQRSAHKSQTSLHQNDHIEEHVPSQHDLEEDKQSIHDKSVHNQSVHDQLDDSSKQKSVSHKDDDDDRREMQRSYSQHHIAEILDQVHGGSEVRQSKHTLIHSDDEEDQDPKKDNDIIDTQKPLIDDEEVKSHRSQKSLQQQIIDHLEEDQVIANNQDDNIDQQSQHNQSQKSLHQASYHSLLKDDQQTPIEIQDDKLENQSVHSQQVPQDDIVHDEEVKSQQQQQHNTQSVHQDDDDQQQNYASQAQLSHRSNQSIPSPQKQQTTQHDEEEKQETPKKQDDDDQKLDNDPYVKQHTSPYDSTAQQQQQDQQVDQVVDDSQQQSNTPNDD